MTFTETTPIPGRRLGKRPPSNRPALRLGAYLTGVVPEHPLTADHLSAIRSWILGANDRFGTCGPTSAANLVRMLRALLLGQDVTVTDEAVFDLYRRSGNPDFDPATGAGDGGVDLQVMLEAWLAGGLEVTHADGTTEVVKPVAFAKVDASNLDEIRAGISIFAGLLFGVDLEEVQQTQTDDGLWDYERSPEWGGHAVLSGRYTSAKTGRDIDVITWAEEIGTTDAFVSRQLGEVWVVIFPEHLTHPNVQAGIDLVAFATAFKELTGKTLPIPAPAPPAPPQPTPVPPAPTPPAPTPDPALAFLEEVGRDLEALGRKILRWVTGH